MLLFVVLFHKEEKDVLNIHIGTEGYSEFCGFALFSNFIQILFYSVLSSKMTQL